MKLKLTVIFILTAIMSFGQIVKNQEWIFEKKVTFDDSVRIATGATNGYVLTSDTRGIATWQPSGAGAVQSATVTLDSADIVSLHTTPVTLVAAQGNGTTIVPLSFVFNLTYGGTAYSVSGALEAFIGANSAATNVVQCAYISGYLNSSQDAIYRQPYDASSGAYTGSSIAMMTNNPLLLFAQGANPTTGNSTLKITITYTVVNL